MKLYTKTLLFYVVGFDPFFEITRSFAFRLPKALSYVLSFLFLLMEIIICSERKIYVMLGTTTIPMQNKNTNELVTKSGAYV